MSQFYFHLERSYFFLAFSLNSSVLGVCQNIHKHKFYPFLSHFSLIERLERYVCKSFFIEYHKSHPGTHRFCVNMKFKPKKCSNTQYEKKIMIFVASGKQLVVMCIQKKVYSRTLITEWSFFLQLNVKCQQFCQ